MHTNHFILVDGSSYLYRAFHAMPSLTNSKGMPTGAIYGVVNMLRRLLNEYKPEHIVVVFDDKGRTFRDDLYDKYKANRKAMPEELVPQVEPIHQIVKALGLPILVIPGVEADDVIGTLAKQAAKVNKNTLISTGDKDLAQLVDQHITLVNTMTDTLLDPAGVVAKFGIAPNQMIDYLTLVGDTSDNIPGVPQVGPKTAVKWLQEYGSLDAILEKSAEIKGKVGENLRASLPQIPLTRALVTIKLDVHLDVSLNDLTIQAPDQAALKDLYQEYEFKTWLSELLKNTNSTTTAAATTSTENKYANYETILTEKQLSTWLEKLNQASLFAFDTETTSLNYMDARIVGVSCAIEPGIAMYIPLEHFYLGAPPQLNREATLAKLKPILENPQIKKIGQNIKYDLEVLANHGINLQGVGFDTMLEAYILESTQNAYDMDSLALKFLGWHTIPYTDVAGKGAKQIGFDQVHIEQAATYAAEDADVTLRLHQHLWPKLNALQGLQFIFETIEMPLVSVLARIERNGVLIDGQKLSDQSHELEKRLAELEAEVFTMAGGAFNLNSPKQLQEILFTKLNLPVLQKTPTGQASTADAVLQELALEFPLPRLIIEFRSLSKLITTYTKRLPEQINPATGRIHTSYNQTGAATGRLSSSDPNLQNIPVRTLEGRRIRQAFIAPRGYKLISADYSQIELRIMAHMSDDPALLYAFHNDLDIHKATAAEVLGIPLDSVTAEQRRNAKAINFGLIYGMSAFGLAKQLGVDRHAAQAYIDKYFARYPNVHAYMESTRAKAHQQGYVETLHGRRLYLPDINSSQIMRQKAAERTAINAPLQGTAADLIKRAMINLDAWLQTKKVDAKIIMQVHDELVLEVLESDVETTMAAIKHEMMSAEELKVPLLVSVGVGDNWDAASSH